MSRWSIERKQREALRGPPLMEQILEFLGNTADGVCAIDANQQIRLWNASAESLLGYRFNEVKGHPCYRIFAGVDERGCRVCALRCGSLRAAARLEIVGTRDVAVRTRDGARRWIQLSTFCAPERWTRSVALLHAFRDAGRRRAGGRRPRPARGGRAANLTDREREILGGLADGYGTCEIADRLSICPVTARNHIQHVLQKLGVHSRLEAVALALHRGWI